MFDARYTNLIQFADVPQCTPAQVATGGGCYFNVGAARNSGLELSGDAKLTPDVTVRASYTYLDARNTQTGVPLYYDPYNAASASLVWDVTQKFELEPRVILVGTRLGYDNSTGAPVSMPGYGRLDLIAKYKFTDAILGYVRVENLTNANYEEVYNYGVAGGLGVRGACGDVLMGGRTSSAALLDLVPAGRGRGAAAGRKRRGEGPPANPGQVHIRAARLVAFASALSRARSAGRRDG